MSLVGIEPTISVGELQQTKALDRAASGTGIYVIITGQISYSENVTVTQGNDNCGEHRRYV